MIPKLWWLLKVLWESTGDLLVDKYESLKRFLESLRPNIVTHCEDPKRLQILQLYRQSVEAAHHAVIRDEECCFIKPLAYLQSSLGPICCPPSSCC